MRRSAPAPGTGHDPGAGGPGPGGDGHGGEQVGERRQLPGHRPAGPSGPAAGHRSERPALLPGGADGPRDRRHDRRGLRDRRAGGVRRRLPVGDGPAAAVARQREAGPEPGPDPGRRPLHPGGGAPRALPGEAGGDLPEAGGERRPGRPGPGPPHGHRPVRE